MRNATPNARSSVHCDSDRKHLTAREVERLLEAAKASRNAPRDRCLLLLTFRHGLRVSGASGSYVVDGFEVGATPEDAGPSDLWLVGGGGMIQHFDGTMWSDSSGDRQSLTGLWGSGPNPRGLVTSEARNATG